MSVQAEAKDALGSVAGASTIIVVLPPEPVEVKELVAVLDTVARAGEPSAMVAAVTAIAQAAAATATVVQATSGEATDEAEAISPEEKEERRRRECADAGPAHNIVTGGLAIM